MSAEVFQDREIEKICSVAFAHFDRQDSKTTDIMLARLLLLTQFITLIANFNRGRIKYQSTRIFRSLSLRYADFVVDSDFHPPD